MSFTPDMEVAPQIDGATTSPAADVTSTPDASQQTAADVTDNAVQGQPEAAPEPRWFEIPDENGRVYTRIAEDKLPEVIRNKDRYASEMQRQNEFLMQELQRHQVQQQQYLPQQPPPDPVKQKAAYYAEQMKARGYEADPNFAELFAEAEERAQQTALKAFEAQQVRQTQMRHSVEYENVRAENPWFDIHRNQLTGAIEGNPFAVAAYVQHPGLSPSEHARIARQMAQQMGAQLGGGAAPAVPAGRSPERQAQLDKFASMGAPSANVQRAPVQDSPDVTRVINQMVGDLRPNERTPERIASIQATVRDQFARQRG